MGSRTVQHYSNLYGNNDVFVNAGLSDAFTNAANLNNDGYEGFYKFITPPPSTTPNVFGQYETEQASPWDWWNLAAYDAAWRLSLKLQQQQLFLDLVLQTHYLIIQQ